jgi:hypothetical protein
MIFTYKISFQIVDCFLFVGDCLVFRRGGYLKLWVELMTDETSEKEPELDLFIL